ncbi:MAG: HD-GYP domain-containing protein [Candidatus Omnitrophota bacterium]
MRKSYEAANILLEVSRAISSSLDLETVSEHVLRESAKALRSDHASLFLVDDESGHLLLHKARGFSSDEVANIKILGSWEVINNQLIKKASPIIVNDVHNNALFRKKNLPFFRERLPLKSFLAVPLKKDDVVVGALIVSNKKRPGHLFTGKDQKLLLALSSYIAAALINARLYEKLKEAFIGTVASLTRAIDAKDKYTSGHSERVMEYAVAIAKEMRIEGEALENLRLSSLLHDVGKIGIKESILSKPAKLLGYEKDQMHRHPAIGAKIVEGIYNSGKIIRGILEHHERFDGKGYPAGLKGNGISLAGRIIAVADIFDALTTKRPYHERHSPDSAFSEIRDGSATHFDPKVVGAFVASFTKYPGIWNTADRRR